ncbi:hypothetical protein ACSBLW_08890 [Thioclava sp. FR2]|uniref:hypothetical protein n=1 Tax=Thioclava sp. FR2 TaxID=3445780 RepID=UPI003EC10883
MKSHSRHPNTVILFGAICGIALFLFGYAVYNQTNHRAYAALGPLGFAVIGGAMLHVRWRVKRDWVPVSGKILAKEGFDPTKVTLSFSLGQTQHVGTLEEDTNRRVGDCLSAYVNPEDPETLFPASFVLPVLGTGFLILGTLGAVLTWTGAARIILD